MGEEKRFPWTKKEIKKWAQKKQQHLQFQSLLKVSWKEKQRGGTWEQVHFLCLYLRIWFVEGGKKAQAEALKNQMSLLGLPSLLQATDHFTLLQLDLLQKHTLALVGFNIAVMTNLHWAKQWWIEWGPAWSCPRCYIQLHGPLPEPLNGCLAFSSVQEQSSWSGQHSRQQHFTEHINILPGLSPGELPVHREDGMRDRKRDRGREIRM